MPALPSGAAPAAPAAATRLPAPADQDPVPHLSGSTAATRLEPGAGSLPIADRGAASNRDPLADCPLAPRHVERALVRLEDGGRRRSGRRGPPATHHASGRRAGDLSGDAPHRSAAPGRPGHAPVPV